MATGRPRAVGTFPLGTKTLAGLPADPRSGRRDASFPRGLRGIVADKARGARGSDVRRCGRARATAVAIVAPVNVAAQDTRGGHGTAVSDVAVHEAVEARGRGSGVRRRGRGHATDAEIAAPVDVTVRGQPREMLLRTRPREYGKSRGCCRRWAAVRPQKASVDVDARAATGDVATDEAADAAMGRLQRSLPP